MRYRTVPGAARHHNWLAGDEDQMRYRPSGLNGIDPRSMVMADDCVRNPPEHGSPRASGSGTGGCWVGTSMGRSDDAGADVTGTANGVVVTVAGVFDGGGSGTSRGQMSTQSRVMVPNAIDVATSASGPDTEYQGVSTTDQAPDVGGMGTDIHAPATRMVRCAGPGAL